MEVQAPRPEMAVYRPESWPLDPTMPAYRMLPLNLGAGRPTASRIQAGPVRSVALMPAVTRFQSCPALSLRKIPALLPPTAQYSLPGDAGSSMSA